MKKSASPANNMKHAIAELTIAAETLEHNAEVNLSSVAMYRDQAQEYEVMADRCHEHADKASKQAAERKERAHELRESISVLRIREAEAG